MKNLTLFTQQTTLPIHEQFFETIQGEGYWAGTPTDFIRLAGCPVGCSWCDTGYADGGKNTPRSDRTIAELINELRSPHVVISGGEPFIHKGLPILVEEIETTGRKVQIETSGAFWQTLQNFDYGLDSNPTWVTLSPKQHLSPKYPVHPAMWLRANEIKIVISSGDEVRFYHDYIYRWTQVFGDWADQHWSEYEQYMQSRAAAKTVTKTIYLQPEWNDRDRTLPLTLDLLKQHPKFRLSLQTHKLIGVQ